MLTVEECRGVDARALHGPGEIPHLAKRPALTEGAGDAYYEECGVEGDRSIGQYS